MSRGEFFKNDKRGEILEVRDLLQNSSSTKRVEGMRQALLIITKGYEIDSLFPDVVNCGQTENIKLKKLVFLYLGKTASRNPELAVLAVNTLSNDLSSHLPLVRALALRVVADIGLEDMIEHLLDPLRKCLRDEDPYVRKTAALSVAKLYQKHKDWVEDMELIEPLQEMLNDNNMTVVVNVITALSEMGRLQLNFSSISKLLTAIADTHEWGQVQILEAISKYEPTNVWEANTLSARMTPFFAHSNSAVVLTSVRVFLSLADQISDDGIFSQGLSKISSALKSLLCNAPELQFVCLRNIKVILKKYPHLLSKDVHIFFVKYNDPIYIKLEKLDIIVDLVNDSNSGKILAELREYACDIDVELSRKSILAIGQCALKLDSIASKYVEVLLSLIDYQSDHVMETLMIVIRDLIRKYPGRYEMAINAFTDRLERINDCEARAAFIWMVGEFANRIDDSEDILQNFMNDFVIEDNSVQLALLTAIIKALLMDQKFKQLALGVLNLAVNSENPDLRDRGFIYWRMLSAFPEAAINIVLHNKPPIVTEENNELMELLLKDLGNLSIIHNV